MSNKNDDGHHPLTCNWNKCGAVEPKGLCPFLKPEKFPGVHELRRSQQAAVDRDTHAHCYTVPVEWEYADAHWDRFVDDAGEVLDERKTQSQVKWVTRLRCETCSSEVKRS